MQAVVLASSGVTPDQSPKEVIPKALDRANGKRIIDHTVEFLASDRRIGKIHVCTDGFGYNHFIDWLKVSGYTGMVEVFMNSGARSNGHSGRIGALTELCRKKGIRDDLVVIPGDRLFDISIDRFLDFCVDSDGDVIVVTNGTGAPPKTRCGVAVVTSQQRVISFDPDASRAAGGVFAHPLVFLSSETLPFLGRYISEGNDPDSIGSLIRWSYRKRPLFTYLAEGDLYRVTSGGGKIKKSPSDFEKKEEK